MAKKPVLIFTNWKTPDSSLSGKYELTATINGKEWIERATLKLVDPYIALERIMHVAACTAIDWEDYFNRDPKEIVRMKQTTLLDILDLFETYQTEGFKSKTRRFEYSSHIKVLVPVKEVKPEPIKEEPKMSEHKNPIISMINFVCDPTGTFNVEKQGTTLYSGTAWDLPSGITVNYALGNAFIQGFVGDIAFIVFYRAQSRAQIHSYVKGGIPNLDRADITIPALDKVQLLAYFKQLTD